RSVAVRLHGVAVDAPPLGARDDQLWLVHADRRKRRARAHRRRADDRVADAPARDRAGKGAGGPHRGGARQNRRERDSERRPPAGGVIRADGLGRRRFGAAASIRGQSMEVDGTPRTVVGVMPRGARLPGMRVDDNELWLPMRMSPAEAANEISHNYTMVGRLADGVATTAAAAELDALAAQLAAARPAPIRMGARLVAVEERAAGSVRPALLVASAGVALLLLVAAANASTLLVARAANRRQELAVRAALGATRGRLLGQSIAECVLFAAIGAVGGLLVG